MSVSDGQPGNETVFNNAFISRIADTTVIAIIELANGSSGATVTNVQSAINTNITDILARVVGPGSSTDNALVRFDTTSGKLVQNSIATLTDAGLLTVVDQIVSGTLAVGQGAIPDASAVFEADSTTGGMLVPRMDNTARNNIASPATSLLIFNTTNAQFEFYTGTAWAAVSADSANKTLSNLDSPTSVNQHLIPSADVKFLGLPAETWSNGFFQTNSFFEDFSSGNTTAQFFAGTALPSADTFPNTGTLGLILRGIGPSSASLPSKSIALISASDNNVDAVPTGTVHIESGNKSAGTGDSGNVSLFAGTSAGGSRGKFQFRNGSEGTVGHVLKSTSTTGEAEWAAETSSAAALDVESFTGTDTLDSNNDVALCDTSSGAFTLNLPTAAGITGKRYWIQYTDSAFVNALTIDPSGAETIGGSTTTTLNTEREQVTIVSDGTNWIILERNIPEIIFTFTPTGSWSTNSTWTGNFRRRGKWMHVQADVVVSGAPDSASLTMTLPGSKTIATGDLIGIVGQSQQEFGTGYILDAGVAVYRATAAYNSTTSVILRHFTEQDETNNDVALTDITEINPMTFASTDSVTFNFSVPITGWNA